MIQKTRLIEFGRFAAERRKKRGEGKPETFNFLGFTHICGTNHQTGHFTVHRKTIGKRMAAKLKVIKAQLQRRMHARIPGTVLWLQQVVRGYFQYHAVPGNCERLDAFRKEAPEPAHPPTMANLWRPLGGFDPHRPNSASLSQPALRRQVPIDPR